MNNQSVLEMMGLPKDFGLTLLIFSLILTSAPWLSGYDFGIFKIPNLSLKTRRALRITGPIFLIVTIAVHLPIVEMLKPLKPVEVPPYEQDSVNLWIVGCPHSGNIPAKQLPTDISYRANVLKIDIETKALSAKNFADTLFAALESNSEPDIIAIDNYGLVEGITTPLGNFVGINSKKKIRESLVFVSEAFESLSAGWQYLLSSSRNYKKARALVLDIITCDPEHSRDINNIKTSELEDIRVLAKSAAFAYLAGDTEIMKKISDENSLNLGDTSQGNTVFVNKVEVCGIYGNNKLAFAYILNSFSSDKSVGHSTLLATFRNVNNEWKLLNITGDPMSLTLISGTLQELSRLLIKQKDNATLVALKPAVLITEDGEFPALEGGAFGDFVWHPSPSEDIVAEILEFECNHSSRLFVFLGKTLPEGKLSTGELWTTEKIWHWRVWSISGNGEIALSNCKSFKH